MMRLSLALFGPFRASWDGQPVSFATGAARGLLAYLALESGRPQSRALLAALFWPDQPQAAAYTNLRQTLARLRKAFPDPSDAATFLTITSQTIQFNRAATIDVARFEELFAECAAHDHAGLASCQACLARLEQAAELYHGELLHGLFLEQSQLFEEWLVVRREQLHRQVFDVLHSLVSAYETRRDYTRMRDYARRQLELEPWREEAHMALMRALAYRGERAAALAQYETCRRVLEQELGIGPGPETQVLFERIRAGELSPATLRAPAPLHNLPDQITPFVGRERELAEIASRVAQPDVRLLTLVGAGGMGKTRLALEAARVQLDAFPDGVFFVPLAPLMAAQAIPSAIAEALGTEVHGGDLGQTLQRTLRDKCTLLILDNFEHLLDGAGIVVDLLRAAPRLQILVTSREQLNLRGEYLYFVQGMEHTAGVSLVDAASSSAVRLFVQSARRVRPDFRLEEAQLGAVQQICQLVQGMPLGLELAASWAELLTLHEIAAEIATSADFLEAAWRDAPERQRSMRAVFDWSWALLSEDERRVFGRLAVFRGGFTRNAAQAVAGATLRVLTRLAHKSLLHWSAAGGAVGRYEIHELLRQFAAEQLDSAPDERVAVERRHSHFYLQFVAEREGRLTRSEPREAADEIRCEIDNVRMAWALAADQANLAELDQSAFALRHFYSLTGLHAEGEQAFRLAVKQLQTHREAVKHQNDPHKRTLEQVLSKLLALHANALVIHRSFNQAQAAAQQAVMLGAASGGMEGETFGQFAWGQALMYQACYAEAQSHLEEALRLARSYQASDSSRFWLRFLEYGTNLILGRVIASQGGYARGENLMRQALSIAQSLGDERGNLSCLMQLAQIEALRDAAGARQICEQALSLARKVGDPWAEAMMYTEIGTLARRQGEYGLALELVERGLVMVRQMDDDQAEAIILSRLGDLRSCLGDYPRARALLDRSLDLSRAVGARLGESEALVLLAQHATLTGDHRQGLTYAEQGRQIAQQIGSRATQARAFVIQGRAYEGQQRLCEAATLYRQALALCDEIGNAPLALTSQAGLASVALSQREPGRALQYVEKILIKLDDQPQLGLDDPFYVYLVCYCVLEKQHDPRASMLLQTARRLLKEYADQIADDGLRRSFLEQVATHRELLHAGGVESCSALATRHTGEPQAGSRS